MNNSSMFTKQFEKLDVRFVKHPLDKYEFGVIASDLALALESESDGHKFARSIDKSWKSLEKIETSGGLQSLVVIWEPGLYQLLSVSRNIKAKPFRRWLFGEVLPSVHKMGLYNTLPFNLIETSNLVWIEQNDYWTVSTSIAKVFDKSHSDIICNFDQALKSLHNFDLDGLFKKIDTTYIDDKECMQKAYKVNRALFNYVCLSYQGYKMNQAKLKFISAFEEIEHNVKIYLTQQTVYNDPKRQQVYVLKNTVTGMVKVGITNDIKRRVSELQNASGCEISIEYIAPKSDNAKYIEQTIHQILEEHRGIGEWFSITPEEVINLLQKQKFIIEPQQLLLTEVT